MNWVRAFEIPKISIDRRTLVVYGNHRPADLGEMFAVLTPDEIACVSRIRSSIQRKTWISCHVTLRIMLGNWLGMNPSDVEICKNRFGRPFLANSNLFFSLSHTNSSYLLGFSFAGKIGVDIEELSEEDDLNELIEYAFSKEEADFCKNGNLHDRFLEIWTFKEAFLKATGVGLVNELKSVNVAGKLNNLPDSMKFKQSTFVCPGGETGSIVFRGTDPVRCIWY
ncbi:MAG: 4'-phosphopantetheinyl transferase superfamily protein [Prolixibacteraceae bacterium]|jgi:4'-phosphopantetheinyl transferase|nr:4'-phosphopantetheinyl transferase superfamily protein [Prolixibacteraceae bacterium]